MPTAPALVTVLLNADDRGGWHTGDTPMVTGYRKDDRLLPIWRELITYDTETTNFTQEANEMFAKLNQDERPGALSHRSLSVGDVVLFETPYGRSALAISTVGFEPVTDSVAEHFTSLL